MPDRRGARHKDFLPHHLMRLHSGRAAVVCGRMPARSPVATVRSVLPARPAIAVGPHYDAAILEVIATRTTRPCVAATLSSLAMWPLK